MADIANITAAADRQTPGDEVLISLVWRLRSHVKNIHNAAARRTVGRDMTVAADVIEQLLDSTTSQDAAAAAMVALLGRSGYAAWTGGAR